MNLLGYGLILETCKPMAGEHILYNHRTGGRQFTSFMLKTSPPYCACRTTRPTLSAGATLSAVNDVRP